jgi:cellulose synthase/poly-beta-1,6-N-acetylglucosamine synthase-like glycosyltransferase
VKISVITPTWQRHSDLLNRCIPSVLAQDYPDTEHIIVSDGDEPGLYPALLERYGAEIAAGRIRYGTMHDHDPSRRWGHRARLAGIEMARADVIAWLDDDNSWRPHHLTVLAAALEANPAAGFAYSQIQVNSSVVGDGQPRHGQIDTSVMICRTSALAAATWRDDGQQTVDWDLAERWIAAGVGWVFVPQVTADWRM